MVFQIECRNSRSARIGISDIGREILNEALGGIWVGA
jgi:hypothetical protein